MELRLPNHITIYTEKEKFTFTDTQVCKAEDITVFASENADSLGISLCADTSAVTYIRLRWNFTYEEKRNEAVRVLGDDWERTYGNSEWRCISAQRCMPWVCAVSNGSDANRDYAGRYTECFGVKVRPSALCFWQYETSGVILWLDVRCGGMGVILEGRRLALCDIVFGNYRDMSAFDALKKHYCELCKDPLLVDHKVYGTNNWYFAYGKSSHEDILKDTALLAQRCSGLDNPPYMVIDDCWEKNRIDAPWDELSEGFYDMKLLASQIKDMGVRPGIWIRPLADTKFSTPFTNAQYRNMRNQEYLDPSHPAILEFIKSTINTLVNDWGYTFIKHDFTTWDIFGYWGFEKQNVLADDGWHFYDRSKTSAEIITNLYRTIYEATRGNALINGCNVMGHLSAGLHHIQRVGDDTSGLEWERTRNYGVNALAFRLPQHGTMFIADADCIGITEHIQWKMNYEWLKALSASGTPMFISPDPKALNDEIVEQMIQAYARSSVQEDVMIPLDWMENVCPERWLLNGEEVTFSWYPDEGVESFEPKLEPLV